MYFVFFVTVFMLTAQKTSHTDILSISIKLAVITLVKNNFKKLKSQCVLTMRTLTGCLVWVKSVTIT